MILGTDYSQKIDLRGTPCPVNLIRCRLAIEDLKPKDLLEVYLDKGEPESMVISGLRQAGHKVEIIYDGTSWLKLVVICGAG